MFKHVKKALPFILAAAMMAALFPFTAYAANTAHVSISVSPSSMNQQGTATVTITLTNTNLPAPAPNALPGQGELSEDPGKTDDPGETVPPIATEVPTEPPTTPPPVETEVPGTQAPTVGGDYTNITISNNYGVAFETAGVVITPGTSRTFTATMEVSAAMIGVSLPFTVSWSDNGTPMSETATCIISRGSTAYLRVSRTATPANASPGTMVELKYHFTNSGSVKLVNITLVDRKVSNSSNPLCAPFSLEPGASTTVTYEMRMGSSTVESSPTITYYSNGGSTPLTTTVPTLVIGLINSQLTKEVIRGNATPEGVPFTLYLTNNGNQALRGLTVKDELGNSIVGTPFALAVGETRTVQTFIPNPNGVRYVVFYINGYDPNNTEFSDNTESFAVRPYIDTSLLGLTFTAQTTAPLDPDSNRIGVQFDVENTGSLPYRNLVITEDGLGYNLHSWEQLASGESDSVKLDLTLEGERELVFKLTAEDTSGNPYTYEAYITAAYIDANDLVPDQHPEASAGKSDEVGIVHDETELGAKLDKLITSTGEKLMKWFRVLGIIAIIAAVAMIVLGVSEIVIRRNRRSRKKA